MDTCEMVGAKSLSSMLYNNSITKTINHVEQPIQNNYKSIKKIYKVTSDTKSVKELEKLAEIISKLANSNLLNCTSKEYLVEIESINQTIKEFEKVYNFLSSMDELDTNALKVSNSLNTIINALKFVSDKLQIMLDIAISKENKNKKVYSLNELIEAINNVA